MNRKKEPLQHRLVIPTGVKESCNVATLAEPFKTDWYNQLVLKGGL